MTIGLVACCGPPHTEVGCDADRRVTIADMVTGRQLSDRELIDRSRAGDTGAFSRLLRRHDASMRRLASTMLHEPSAVDDVLQDAYFAAYRGLDGFRGEAAFSTWLHRIVHRSCLHHLRRTRPTSSLDVLSRTSDVGVGERFDQVSTAAAVRGALATLSSEHRAVLALVDGEGLSYAEVGELLGIGAGTVASRLSRAREGFRAAYHQSNSESETT